MNRIGNSFVLTAAFALFGIGLTAPSASATVCGPLSPMHVSSPNVGTGINSFNAMTATSPTNAWAVGSYMGTSAQRALAEHWNGTTWSVVNTPNSGSGTNILLGAASVSKKDAWAVGFGGSPAARTLAEHWNGTAWKIVKSPNIGKHPNYLQAVTALSSSNVWAVGQEFNGSVYRTLIEHWNGTSWVVVKSPNATIDSNVLFGVSAASASNIWAVGYAHVVTFGESLAEHWNGSKWKAVMTPIPANTSPYLKAVATLSKSNAWAVGYSYDNVSHTNSTLIEHWNGTVWSVVTSPSPDPTYNFLYAITAVSPTDIWAVGDAGTMPLALHWDGANWSQIPLPTVGTGGDAYGAASTSSGIVWIGGDSTSGSAYQTSVFQTCP